MNATNGAHRPGDILADHEINGVRITLTLSVDGQIARNVFAGPARIAALCTSYPNLTIAARHTSLLWQNLNAGRNVDQVIDHQATSEAALVAEMQQVVHDAMQVAAADPNTVAGDREIAVLQDVLPVEDTDELAEQIRSDMAARAERRCAEQAAFNQEIANLTGRPIGQAKPTTITNTVPATGRTNTPSVAAVPPSDPMARILAEAAANNGRVARSKEATSTQLIALERRGLVVLTFERQGNTRRISGAQLTNKGFRYAAVNA